MLRSLRPETSALAEDLIDALCGLLLLPFMPATALWHIGWLLRQLLPAAPGGGPRLTDQQCGLLESAMRLSRQFLMAELNGAWPACLRWIWRTASHLHGAPEVGTCSPTA